MRFFKWLFRKIKWLFKTKEEKILDADTDKFLTELAQFEELKEQVQAIVKRHDSFEEMTKIEEHQVKKIINRKNK